MKKILFLLIILGTLLFCGCAATADMEYGIDADNNAYTKLRVNINAGDLLPGAKNRLRSALRDIAEHYSDTLGFECEYDYFTENENNAYIVLTKTEPADSFEEAFENLKAMLCDERLTVFSEVSCELSDTRREYAYRIDGTTELYRAIENTYNSGISKANADYIKEELEHCSFSVTLCVPDNTKLYRLSLTEPTEISHTGRVSVAEDKLLLPFITEFWNKAPAAAVVLFGALTVVSLTGIIIGIMLIRRSKKKALTETDGSELQNPQNGEYHYDEEKDQDTI